MAFSDVNMSSEGSCASKVRQFGLYKTIDSQTAEFLKLSRKRQIRRGCACAAVSTAITVTVVLSALLVYEYGFRTDFKAVPSPLRQLNWFQTVNDSKATFVKNTPISNKSNGKILAVILKALDQKRYLETIVEDHSSQRPARERTTYYPFQKNVFADRNRKIPSKMYEGYKPTSQELFKTRRMDSFVKARKVMDYQRVMTYLNTMSLSKRSGETIHTDVSSASKPYFTGNHVNVLLQDIKHQTARANKLKENHNINCTCPPRSNLTDILEKLYKGIQNLRPKSIERIPNNTKTHKLKSNSTIKIQQSKYYSDQRASISRKNIQHTTGKIPRKLSTAKFTQYPLTTMKSNHKDKGETSRHKQNETTTNRNEYNTISYNTSHTGETTPWKLDFGNSAYDDAISVYVNDDVKLANSTTTEKMTERDAMARYSPIDEQFDFGDKIYNIPLEPYQYNNVNPAHQNQSKITEKYSYPSNYIDGISKEFAKSSVEYYTAKPLDTKLFSYEIVDPIKMVSTDSVKPAEKKQNTTELVANDTIVERKNISRSLQKQEDRKQATKPLTLAARKVNEKLPLDPMIQSYLLSKKYIGILNLDSENTLQGIQLQTTDSEELPFNLKFLPNEDNEHTTIVNDLHTAKVTSNTDPRYDKNNDKQQAKNSQEHPGGSKVGREKIVPLTQVWKPIFVSKKPFQSSTEGTNHGHKKTKIKEIFYMTGGETPVEDFEDNLSALMYYDKSPVNYTALANSYLNKMESGSIELSKSMLPESRPSPLEIRRTHKRVDFYTSNLSASDEK